MPKLIYFFVTGRWNRRQRAGLLAWVCLTGIGAAHAASAWDAEHQEAVRAARRGDTAAALVILERLQRAHPNDLSVARDRVLVAEWAGQGTLAIRLYQALPPGPQPDFVVEAVARAYRDQHQPNEALALYRQGETQSPANAEFAAGEIRALVDLGTLDQAAARADAALQQYGENVAVLLAAGVVAAARNQPIEALRYCDRALKVDPTSRDARHDRILAIERMGAPQVARRLADADPGILAPDEYRRIEGSEAAAFVRWGPLDPAKEAERFAMTDRAIAALDALIAQWSAAGPDARNDALRARFDRIVALRDRVRMIEVLAEYDDLRRSNVELPAYALNAVGDAYLYLRQPEAARDLYQRVLATDPNNFNVRLALFYVDVDLDDLEAAYREIDSLDADQGRWIYLKGAPDPIPNPDRVSADLAAASARLYGDQLEAAERRFAAMAGAAPNNTSLRAGLAGIYAARGWPRRADAEYALGRALKDQDLELEVGQARNDLSRRDYPAAEVGKTSLMARFPENLEAQRLDRLWHVHEMAELHVDVTPSFTSATNVQGGDGLTFDTRLYTPPIGYNWRLFGDEEIAHQELPQGQGEITLHRSSAGVEYRDPDLLATLEGSFNTYRQQDPFLGSVGEEKLGARASATWSINDYWQLGGTGELFSHDTPLRALRSGVTADSGTVDLTYRESESRELRLVAEAMPFSDGNFRTSLDGRYTQRVLTEPHFKVDVIGGLAGSRDSADANRQYYNPSQDVLATGGVALSQPLYRRYELIYDHRLTVTPGVYWENGFGTAPVVAAEYEHRLRINDVIDTSLGVGFGRQPYDGIYENTVTVLFHFVGRF